ncbi:MAG TPA: glycosyltransferase family 2 protein, partial [Alphaproteobacteria bacterium]|nr:glycosyltransferase family 2 protein [Alphaproteobacteria bacterium]
MTAPHRPHERSTRHRTPRGYSPLTAPLVTIGLCAHNAADTIAAAVDSALAQTGVATEIVIVDDASTDGTRALLEDCARQHPAIRLFVNATNRGVAAARNTIIREARGTFIGFFDDDDRSAPERVARQLARLTG